MESRNITLTLDKAKEFYNSGNEALKEVALQAYTEDELTVLEWQNIKTFEDACKALGVSTTSYIEIPYTAGQGIANHLHAIYKLDIIRRALNQGWNPKMTEGTVYYPYVRFYPAGRKAREVASNNNWKLGESFIADGEKYTLIGGLCNSYSSGGLAYFGFGYGVVRPNRGLLGCKSKEIAEHMSYYFSKEIFEAVYAHHIGLYKWV